MLFLRRENVLFPSVGSGATADLRREMVSKIQQDMTMREAHFSLSLPDLSRPD